MKPRSSFNLKIVASGFLSMNFRYDHGYDDVYDLVASLSQTGEGVLRKISIFLS